MSKTCQHTHALLITVALVLLSSVALAADPGALPEAAASGGPKPGSILVYNYYTSSAIYPGKEDTQITLTNTGDAGSVAVHIFLINGDDCSVADLFLCLTANQTTSFLASDLDPGVDGYAIAVASDLATGRPISYNFLTGSESVKLASGHAASLSAEAFPALYQGVLPDSAASGTAGSVSLDFNGVEYSKLPRVLALDKISSALDGASTIIVVNSLNGNLGAPAGAPSIGNISGQLFDDMENGFSFSASARCQFRSQLSNRFPKTTPKFMSVIPAGRTGWLKLFPAADRGVTGAAISFNPRAEHRVGAFNGGANLNHLRLTEAGTSLTIPVFPPSC